MPNTSWETRLLATDSEAASTALDRVIKSWVAEWCISTFSGGKTNYLTAETGCSLIDLCDDFFILFFIALFFSAFSSSLSVASTSLSASKSFALSRYSEF